MENGKFMRENLCCGISFVLFLEFPTVCTFIARYINNLFIIFPGSIITTNPHLPHHHARLQPCYRKFFLFFLSYTNIYLQVRTTQRRKNQANKSYKNYDEKQANEEKWGRCYASQLLVVSFHFYFHFTILKTSKQDIKLCDNEEKQADKGKQDVSWLLVVSFIFIFLSLYLNE